MYTSDRPTRVTTQTDQRHARSVLSTSMCTSDRPTRRRATIPTNQLHAGRVLSTSMHRSDRPTTTCEVSSSCGSGSQVATCKRDADCILGVRGVLLKRTNSKHRATLPDHLHVRRGLSASMYTSDQPIRVTIPTDQLHVGRVLSTSMHTSDRPTRTRVQSVQVAAGNPGASTMQIASSDSGRSAQANKDSY